MTHKLYRIPDLEWKEGMSAFGEVHSAKSATGFWCNVWRNYPDGAEGWSWCATDHPTERCDSLASGKSAANAHFRDRMARGLVEVTCES